MCEDKEDDRFDAPFFLAVIALASFVNNAPRGGTELVALASFTLVPRGVDVPLLLEGEGRRGGLLQG